MPSSVNLGAPVQQVDIPFLRNSHQSFPMATTDVQREPDPPSGSVQLEFEDGTIRVGRTS